MRQAVIRVAPILLGAALSARSSRAQVPAVRSYGTEDEAIAIVSSRGFHAENGGGLGIGWNFRWSTDGGWLSAPLDFLPNGSRITRITCYFQDTHPMSNLHFSLCHNRFDAESGADLDSFCDFLGNSAGVDGDSYIVDNEPRDVVYRRDLDGNGTTDIESYDLRVLTPSGTSATAIRAVEIRWQRRVSPAPANATFNDVPTNHPFFQFIEALADSGITVGCGNGNYCPEAPLTRGQMAVFLAKALGLHWPWNAQ